MNQPLPSPLMVASRDGVHLAVHEYGSGPIELLFIHGFNQSHLAWLRQVNDPGLREACRMVAFDLRGHGASDKPLLQASYSDPTLWAADVHAVIAAKGLKRPVLVGWSYAGRVITDFIRIHGCGALAGINFVGALLKADGKLMGHGRRHFTPMLSGDLAVNIEGTCAFLRACFERAPESEDFETMLAYNMVMPPLVRRFVLERATDPADVLARISVPVLISHGAQDQVILPATADFAKAQIPGSRVSLYDGVGHSPFYEDAARFNAELLAFATACVQD